MRLLDAARAEFIAHGYRRTSVGDIARRAKIARQTVYRRLGDKGDIVRQVTLREVVEFLEAVGPRVLAHPTPVERAAEAFVLGVAECRTNELLAALRRFEPETVQPLLDDRASALEPVRTLIAMAITSEGLPMEAAVRAADLMFRVAASLVIVPSPVLPIDTDDHARWLARTYFGPLIEASAVAA